jgi:hypothetical protein
MAKRLQKTNFRPRCEHLQLDRRDARQRPPSRSISKWHEHPSKPALFVRLNIGPGGLTNLGCGGYDPGRWYPVSRPPSPLRKSIEGIGLEAKAGCGTAAMRGSRRAFGAPRHDVRY